jgi:hypothetical protein
VTSWEGIFRGAKKWTILYRWGWVVTNGIWVIAQPEMGGVCTSPWGSLEGIHWDAKNEVIPWDSPAGMLGSKWGWLWCSTSPQYGNEDVLICIFSPFLTQLVLKLWWPWTYQHSLDKLAYVRVIPKWVTFREVWVRGAKSKKILCCWGWVVTDYNQARLVSPWLFYRTY